MTTLYDKLFTTNAQGSVLVAEGTEDPRISQSDPGLGTKVSSKLEAFSTKEDTDISVLSHVNDTLTIYDPNKAFISVDENNIKKLINAIASVFEPQLKKAITKYVSTDSVATVILESLASKRFSHTNVVLFLLAPQTESNLRSILESDSVRILLSRWQDSDPLVVDAVVGKVDYSSAAGAFNDIYNLTIIEAEPIQKFVTQSKNILTTPDSPDGKESFRQQYSQALADAADIFKTASESKLDKAEFKAAALNLYYSVILGLNGNAGLNLYELSPKAFDAVPANKFAGLAALSSGTAGVLTDRAKALASDMYSAFKNNPMLTLNTLTPNAESRLTYEYNNILRNRKSGAKALGKALPPDAETYTNIKNSIISPILEKYNYFFRAIDSTLAGRSVLSQSEFNNLRSILAADLDNSVSAANTIAEFTDTLISNMVSEIESVLSKAEQASDKDDEKYQASLQIAKDAANTIKTLTAREASSLDDKSVAAINRAMDVLAKEGFLPAVDGRTLESLIRISRHDTTWQVTDSFLQNTFKDEAKRSAASDIINVFIKPYTNLSYEGYKEFKNFGALFTEDFIFSVLKNKVSAEDKSQALAKYDANLSALAEKTGIRLDVLAATAISAYAELIDKLRNLRGSVALKFRPSSTDKADTSITDGLLDFVKRDPELSEKLSHTMKQSEAPLFKTLTAGQKISPESLAIVSLVLSKLAKVPVEELDDPELYSEEFADFVLALRKSANPVEEVYEPLVTVNAIMRNKSRLEGLQASRTEANAFLRNVKNADMTASKILGDVIEYLRDVRNDPDLLQALINPESADPSAKQALKDSISEFAKVTAKMYYNEVAYESEQNNVAAIFNDILEKGTLVTKPQVVKTANVIAGAAIGNDTISFLNLAGSLKDPIEYENDKISRVAIGIPQEKVSTGLVGGIFSGSILPEALRISELGPVALQAFYLHKTIPALHAAIAELSAALSDDWANAWGDKVAAYRTDLLANMQKDAATLETVKNQLFQRLEMLAHASKVYTIGVNTIDLADKNGELLATIIGKAVILELLASYSDDLSLEAVSYLTILRMTNQTSLIDKMIDAAKLFISILNYKLTLDSIDALVKNTTSIKDLSKELNDKAYQNTPDYIDPKNPYAETAGSSYIKQKIYEETLKLQAEFAGSLQNYVSAKDQKTSYNTIDNPFIRGLLVRYTKFINKAFFEDSMKEYKQAISDLIASGSWAWDPASLTNIFAEVPIVLTSIRPISSTADAADDDTKVTGFLYKTVKGVTTLVPVNPSEKAGDKFVGTKVGAAGRNKSPEQSVQYVKTYQEDLGVAYNILNTLKLVVDDLGKRIELPNVEQVSNAISTLAGNIKTTKDLFELYGKTQAGGFTQTQTVAFQKQILPFLENIKPLPDGSELFGEDLVEALRKPYAKSAPGFAALVKSVLGSPDIQATFEELGNALVNFAGLDQNTRQMELANALPELDRSKQLSQLRDIVKQYQTVIAALEVDLQKVATAASEKVSASILGAIYPRLSAILDTDYIKQISYLVTVYGSSNATSMFAKIKEQYDIVTKQLEEITNHGNVNTEKYTELVAKQKELEEKLKKSYDKNIGYVWSDAVARIQKIRNTIEAGITSQYKALVTSFNTSGLYVNPLNKSNKTTPAGFIQFMQDMTQKLPQASIDTAKEVVESVFYAQEIMKVVLKEADEIASKKQTTALSHASYLLYQLGLTYNPDQKEFVYENSQHITSFSDLFQFCGKFVIPGILDYMNTTNAVKDIGKINRVMNMNLAYGFYTAPKSPIAYIPVYEFDKIYVLVAGKSER